jgi:REP element-mobilizing transposase RayT
MARPLRVEFENAIYHLCARGNAGQMVFCDERDYARFLKLLGESAQRFEAAILCFVLMGNHFHLVAQTHRPNLRRWMHWLLVSYTVYFNRRHRSSGHLFQGRYKSFLVQEGDYLVHISRYLNPKEADQPTYPWSRSYARIALRVAGPMIPSMAPW